MEDAAALTTVLKDCARILSLCRRGAARGQHGVTLHQAGILNHLDTDVPVGVAELAGLLGLSLSTTSLSLDRLARQGCILRQRDPHDGRRVNVRLTSTGRDLRDSAAHLDDGRLAAALAQLSPAERRQAVRGLALLADAATRTAPRGKNSSGRGVPARVPDVRHTRSALPGDSIGPALPSPDRQARNVGELGIPTAFQPSVPVPLPPPPYFAVEED